MTPQISQCARYSRDDAQKPWMYMRIDRRAFNGRAGATCPAIDLRVRKKVAWNLSAFHATQGRRIVTSDVRFVRSDVHQSSVVHLMFYGPAIRLNSPVSSNES